MVFNNNLLLGAAGQSGAFNTTLIERSAWFDGVADDLSRTFALGNPSRWTTSLWVRFLDFGTNAMILSAGPDTSNQFYFYRVSANTIHIASITSGTTTLNKVTTQVFRDNQWYHFLLDFEDPSMDFYVNGELVTSFTTNTENAGGTQWMKNVAHNVAIRKFDNSGRAKIYVAQLCTIDNKSIQNSDLTVTSFLDTYTFGANGSQYVPRADATITALATAAGGNSFCLTTAIGDGTDASGNGNNFTPTSMSDAANGTADTPSDTFPTFSPINLYGVTLADGNLKCNSAGWWSGAAATMSLPTTGKWYIETLVGNRYGSYMCQGFAPTNYGRVTEWSQAIYYGAGDYTNTPNYGLGMAMTSAGPSPFGFYAASGTTTAFATEPDGSTLYSTNEIYICHAIDLDNERYWVGTAFTTDSSVTWFGPSGSGADPETPSTGLDISSYLATYGDYGLTFFHGPNATSGNPYAIVDFGQSGYTFTKPTDYSELCTANLPTPDYQGIDYFNPILYTGNGSTNAITGVGFQPDLVWIKNTSLATSHSLYDAVRGVQEQLESDNTSAETTETTGLTAFGSDGFTVGSLAQVNTNTNNFVGWSWLAGGAGASNTDGSITSTVSKAAAGHFSVVTYTGTGAIATVGHGLGSVPGFFVVKKRTSGTCDYWPSWHKDLTLSYIPLDQSIMQQGPDASIFNDTDPTSTVFTVGSGTNSTNTNASGSDYIAYCFAPVPGVCKIGSYIGNGSADGPFSYTGFRPSWLMVKRIDSAADWHIIDVKRDPYNVMDSLLFSNLSNAESSDAAYNRDLLSDGFKIRTSYSYVNASGGSFIFIAMADIAGGGDLPPIYGR